MIKTIMFYRYFNIRQGEIIINILVYRIFKQMTLERSLLTDKG